MLDIWFLDLYIFLTLSLTIRGFVCSSALNISAVEYSLPQTRPCTCCYASSTSWWGWPAPPPSLRSLGQLGWMKNDANVKELRQQVAESSRKMQELRAQIQVIFTFPAVQTKIHLRTSLFNQSDISIDPLFFCVSSPSSFRPSWN